MKRIFTKIYAWALLALMIGGVCLAVAFAWSDLDNLIEAVVGAAVSFAAAPVIHELGHVTFAYVNDMEIVYCKCFCFRYYQKDGKKRVGFANPFEADETQVLPRGGENMEKRAYAFTVGGLVYGGAYFALVLAATVVCLCLHASAFTLYATLPYAAYLFLLNAIPVEYPTGKTDALIARGLKNGGAVERTMLNVMRIHGELQSGKSYAEIDEKAYMSAPQIAMDEPLYLAIMDARYRYYLELEEYEKAFDVLKRMKAAGEYMTDEEILTLERDLAYLCLIGGNDGVLKTAVENGGEYWASDDVAIKRTLALYMTRCGEAERAEALTAQAQALLEKISVAGQRKHEAILLSRIK